MTGLYGVLTMHRVESKVLYRPAAVTRGATTILILKDKKSKEERGMVRGLTAGHRNVSQVPLILIQPAATVKHTLLSALDFSSLNPEL